MPSVMPTGISMSYWTPLWFTVRAVARDDQVTIVDGKKIVKSSTGGWELCCEWKDGSTSWQKLSDLKESHPLQVAEFAFAAQIADEPAFNCTANELLVSC